MDINLYPDDVVVHKTREHTVGVVERTHYDLDSHTPHPGREETEKIDHDRQISGTAFKKFLKDGAPPKGTVLVRWQNNNQLALMPVSKLKLIDRSLLVGDCVKPTVKSALSGVVLNTFTTCSLQPMCDIEYQHSKTLKGLLSHDDFECPSNNSPFCIPPDVKPALIHDVPASELNITEALEPDDLVIYKDWLGRVDVLNIRIQIRLLDNCVVEISDEDAENPRDANAGQFYIGDIAKTKKGFVRTGKWIYGSYNPNTPPVGTVVNVRVIMAEIAWLARRIDVSDQQDTEEPEYILEEPELESQDFTRYDKTRRPSPNTTNPYISNSEIDVNFGLRVRFRDIAAARVKYNSPSNPNRIPRLDRQDNLGYDLNVFDVMKFDTSVTVQWQDLSVTTEKSIDLVPDESFDDEHAVWPGDIATTLTLVPVPNMPDVETPEKIGVVQHVRAEERMARIRWLPGSSVHYLTVPEDDQGIPPPFIERIRPGERGEEGVQEEEISLYDVEAPSALNVRRGDIVLLNELPPNVPPSRPGHIPWLGEIVDTPANGSLVIRLGAAEQVQDIELPREKCIVTIRSDGTTHDDGFNAESQTDADDNEIFFDHFGSGDDYYTTPARYEDENGEPMDEDEVENTEWESEDEDLVMEDAPELQISSTPDSTTPIPGSDGQVAPAAPEGRPSYAAISEAPPAYMILDGDVPLDHRYRDEPTTTTPLHMKRTQKEHKILRDPTSLPDGVYIRAWETRLDLLRILIVGPTETPYENAPFVVDFYLPDTFPAEPPRAHFHSWPSLASLGSLGRVNPNLYEDGKICLSLLGTWEGQKGEGWVGARSTLLQVIVSLLGLVLVREPYYNEAGYEMFVGEEANKRPSALYSERVFIRAKGFLITALEETTTGLVSGLKGLEDIVQWLYWEEAGPRLLDATLAQVEEVLEKSDHAVGGEPDGVTLMSKGACIPLRRVLARLQALKTRDAVPVE